MNGYKSHRGVNPHNSKRGYEQISQHHGPPPSKKPRHESNLDFQKSYHANADIKLPDQVPELPQITPEYETLVFTHPGSTARGNNGHDRANYDRLEFLGDAYLEIIASKIIFDNYPTTNAGGMCRLRESVVKNETLSKYSIMYGFDKKLRIQEQPKDGNKGWTKIYGDVFEAYAAAVVLSDEKQGLARLQKWLTELWSPVLQEVKVQLPDEKLAAKEELARKVLCPGVRLNYVEERKRVLHVGQGRESFYVGVYLDGWGWKNQHLGSGEGSSKVIAGQEAAKSALNNHPIIDEIAAKKVDFVAEKAAQNQEKANEGEN